ncbi:MAG: FkbM family methyltransferase [Betaproteobacteria bacterium]|nr:FkbM family methyltransferase [Betaproteobacteria bacterium]
MGDECRRSQRVPRGHRVVIDESWLQEFLGKAADDKSIAFDIGANVGEWSIAMSQVFAGVVAIEPDPRAYSELAAAAPNNVPAILHERVAPTIVAADRASDWSCRPGGGADHQA